jgi:hypothetical protein
MNEDPASAHPVSSLSDSRLAPEITEDDLLAELRVAIFRTHRGECPSDRRLRELYVSAEANQSVTRELLSHIVSCARRLDRVNCLLGLPLLAERYPTDTLGPDRGSKGGPGASGGAPAGGRQLMRHGMRRFQETFEHRPKELRIAVNAFHVIGNRQGEIHASFVSFSHTESRCPDLRGITLFVWPLAESCGEVGRMTNAAGTSGTAFHTEDRANVRGEMSNLS